MGCSRALSPRREADCVGRTEEKKQKETSDWNPVHSIAVASGAGMTMLTCIGLGVYLGLLCDDHLGTSPWGLIFWSVIGGASGVWSVIKRIIGK